MANKLQRCIRRVSVQVNVGKWNDINTTIKAFNKEKQHWLNALQQANNLSYINKFRDFRDMQLANNYVSQYGLQARSWKMALNDAHEMMNKYWLSIIDKVKAGLCKNTDLTGSQKHYANYILVTNFGLYNRLSQVLNKQVVDFNSKNAVQQQISIHAKKVVIKYLLRKIKQIRRFYPKVKLSRSMSMDANMYDVIEVDGKQFLSIMSLNKGKRIRVPLLGNTKGTLGKFNKMYFGNIRIVLLDNRTLEMHYGVDVECRSVEGKCVVGVDLGYSEVFVDNNNNSYGEKFGELLQNKSDKLKLKNQKRNKLYALEKKYIEQGKFKKARNLRKFNLGRIKYNNTINRQNATSECLVNQAVNKLSKTYSNITLVTEKLDKSIAKKIGKDWNRRLSSWIKGYITERIKFKAVVEGFNHKTVNAAYTSQICPVCGYVDRRNRKQDKFECLHCKHVGYSDHVAAMNIANRYFDLEITIYTSYQKVKQILLARFNRGLETEQSGTVTHRTRELLKTMVNP